ncbi:MAG: coproporphyrinogen dehydrogenase HemZ, partial [Oscillospiraceae bacterium]|nr:coproporphyrinogen dehydrogenase HemZ [Oscillospiraceae bacterium]
MKIYLFGHDYRYAVEQMLLTVFPNERPEYPGELPEGDRMEVHLRHGDGAVDATCLIVRGDRTWKGRDYTLLPDDAEALIANRTEQRLVKNAVYRAALESGVPKPVWGALTGVRPGKVLCRILDEETDKEKVLLRFEKEYDVSGKRASLCMDAARYTLRAKTELEEKDICLYVGIPFCPTRCSYCSFVSQSVEKSARLIAPFVDALLK